MCDFLNSLMIFYNRNNVYCSSKTWHLVQWKNIKLLDVCRSLSFYNLLKIEIHFNSSGLSRICKKRLGQRVAWPSCALCFSDVLDFGDTGGYKQWDRGKALFDFKQQHAFFLFIFLCLLVCSLKRIFSISICGIKIIEILESLLFLLGLHKFTL